MGIFDRAPNKKSGEKAATPSTEDADYYDSPVETVSLDGPKGGNQQQQQAGGARPAQPAAKPVVEEEARPSYGIESAIQLMRQLPQDDPNVQLLVTVIKTTLESMKVHVSDIIEDAVKKEKDLEGRVSNLKSAIAEFEKEIQQRRDEIAKLEADHAETSSVKARLQLAEKAQKAQATPAQKSA
jgi:hypothetical protein